MFRRENLGTGVTKVLEAVERMVLELEEGGGGTRLRDSSTRN